LQQLTTDADQFRDTLHHGTARGSAHASTTMAWSRPSRTSTESALSIAERRTTMMTGQSRRRMASGTGIAEVRRLLHTVHEPTPQLDWEFLARALTRRTWSARAYPT